VRDFAKCGLPRLLLLCLAASGLSLAADPQPAQRLPGAFDSNSQSGWVLADLNGDQHADLATARSGVHDSTGYTQEVRITLGAFRQTSFHFQSRGATVELSSRDVDGDLDGDLVVFEPLSNQPIGVWLNDGAGFFHEGRLADFQKLWSQRSGSAWRLRIQPLRLFAISDDRTPLKTPARSVASQEPIVSYDAFQNEPHHRQGRRARCLPRGPPRNF
jgi:hypothetical protein